MPPLHDLFLKISTELVNSKLKDLRAIIEEYDGIDWKDHILFDDATYNRNVIFRNDIVEIIVISWNNNQNSAIHDHPEQGCLMKILQGGFDEHIYNKELEIINVRCCKKGDVCYQEGIDGLHNISNKDIQTVSLHIYAPPNYVSNKY